MTRLPCFTQSALTQLREVCCQDARLVAVYAFDLRRRGDCDLAALFARTPPWADRLDLELAMAKALGREGVELIDLRRMPLVARFDVINRGEPIYVGKADALSMFIEETVVRYAAFYPLLEALYWKVETAPLAEDMLQG
jgi:hypothetical protein